ncbi:hypothetical protein LXL04_001253 [Taraxacum kok-saghyz]
MSPPHCAGTQLVFPETSAYGVYPGLLVYPVVSCPKTSAYWVLAIQQKFWPQMEGKLDDVGGVDHKRRFNHLCSIQLVEINFFLEWQPSPDGPMGKTLASPRGGQGFESRRVSIRGGHGLVFGSGFIDSAYYNGQRPGHPGEPVLNGNTL